MSRAASDERTQEAAQAAAEAAAGPMAAAPAGQPVMLRRALVGLAVTSGVATAAELAMQHHWQSWEQLLPWGFLAALAAALPLLLSGSRGAIATARLIAVAVAASAVYGVVSHVQANYDAGPLDFRYETRWATMSAADRLWTAFTNGVGPSPTLAPGAVAVAAALLLLATLRSASGPGRQAL